jgi:pimeloyl-ACP methyl ester carboxylesterase
MNDLLTQSYEIAGPGWKIHAKQWMPAKPSAQIPIVLLHDSLGSVDLWRDFPERLALGLSRSVIAYDRLGFGQSDPRTELPGLDFIAEEAVKYFPVVKKGLSLTRYVLFGHSVGGSMAIEIAARDAGCAAVITMASQAFVEERTAAGIRDAMRVFEQPGQIERLEKWHGAKARWVLRAWSDLWLSPEFAGWSLAERIGQVVCPVLAIHGDRDEYGSIAFPEFIVRGTGGRSQMLILENCGHMPHKEKLAEVVEAVKVFLEVTL